MSTFPSVAVPAGSLFGFRLPYLPDFLADHTLLGEGPAERIREHCRRWTHLVAGLWTDADRSAAYALRFAYHPGRGEVTIALLGRSGDPGTLPRTARDLERALAAFGIRPDPLGEDDLRQGLEARHRCMVEVRQREEVVPLRQLLGWAKGPGCYNVLPWWGPGGPFLVPLQALVTQDVPVTLGVLVKPWRLTEEERDYLAERARLSRTLAGTTLNVDVEKTITDRSADPQAEWVGRLYAANLRRLSNPFLLTAHCLADDPTAARSVALALAATVGEEAPYETPLGETAALQSCAQVVVYGETEVPDALQAYQRLDFRRSAEALAREPVEQRLRYLVDARGAASAFRLPVSVRGGVPGVAVRQQPPDFHPGPRTGSAPRGHLRIGHFHVGGVASVRLKELTKHALVTGFTGSGKTNTVLSLLDQLWREHRVPFLVIESAKHEYRNLLHIDAFRGTENLRVYTLGNETCAPFRLNPFELIPGVRLEAHLGRLQTCFEAALPQFGVLPSLVAEALEEVYRDRGWALTDVAGVTAGTASLPFPRMRDLYDKVFQVADRRKYAGEIRQNIIAAASGRIKPLLLGSKGRMFDTGASVPPAGELLDRPVVLELNDLNEQDKALVMMFLLTLLREHRELHPAQDLQHVTVVEEAHNVLENVASHGPSEVASDTRGKAVQAFCNMLAEVRAYGEGLIIADQSPSKLAPDALRNTNVQIAHQLRDSGDREAVANAMIMDDEQRDYLGKLEPGNAAVFYTGLQKATFVSVPTLILVVPRPAEGQADRGITIGCPCGITGIVTEDRVGTPLKCGQCSRALLVTFEVADPEVAASMAALTEPYRRLDLPFGGDCELCRSQCRYRQAVLSLCSDPAPQRELSAAFRHLAPPERWQAIACAAGRAAQRAGCPARVDAAWCYFLHQVRPQIRQEVGAHDRAQFEAAFQQFTANGPSAKKGAGQT